MVFEAWGKSPESSIPQVMKSSAELEGAYRFFNNPRVDSDAVLSPHISCTWERARQSSEVGQWVLAVQDTTEMRFGGTKHRHGLGSLMNDGHGFYAHVGLLVSLVGDSGESSVGVPLGVGASEILVRPLERPKRPEGMSKTQWERARHFAEDNEFLRWGRVSRSLDDTAMGQDIALVHVADREADEFDWLTSLKNRGGRFVVRQTKNRRVKQDAAQVQEHGELLLDELLARAHPVRAMRQVGFETAATSGGRRRKQARKGRSTLLEVRAVSTCVKRPHLTRSSDKELDLNVVVVREVDPPEGQQPIEWRLLTTEPIETAADVLRIVDAYRARWLIEEFFKALKTGCSYERLQLETLHGLKIALSLCFGLAWHMLLLRTLARDALDVPAHTVLTKAQHELLLLAASNIDNPWSVRLPKAPTVTDVMYAVARMGGHVRANGPPGWQTLGRGFQELNRLLMAQHWLLARCDKS
ncbi:MAG: IS4 family transposase [Deltaproteobacteria bacterium]|nr:IS4 family transposase [Deltaproteobacteria bacterium]